MAYGSATRERAAASIDLAASAMLRDVGGRDRSDWRRGARFRNVRVLPFEEADGTLAPDYRSWRFPWTIIAAER